MSEKEWNDRSEVRHEKERDETGREEMERAGIKRWKTNRMACDRILMTVVHPWSELRRLSLITRIVSLMVRQLITRASRDVSRSLGTYGTSITHHTAVSLRGESCGRWKEGVSHAIIKSCVSLFVPLLFTSHIVPSYSFRFIIWITRRPVRRIFIMLSKLKIKDSLLISFHYHFI